MVTKIELKMMPPSVNHYWVRTKRGFFVSKEGQDFKKTIAIAAHNIKPFCGDVALKIEFVPSDRRKRDIDNIAKCVLDSLKGIVYEDDSQVVHLEMWKKEPQKEPRLSIECCQLPLPCGGH